jgi:hypothetical protein
MHQSGRTFVHEIYVLENTFHHSNIKVLPSNVKPFLSEIPFVPSKFFVEVEVAHGQGRLVIVEKRGWAYIMVSYSRANVHTYNQVVRWCMQT